MAKDLTFNVIKNLQMNIKLNYDVSGLMAGGEYYPASIEILGDVASNGVSYRATEQINIGTPQKTPFTPKEIYTRVRNAFGVNVANKIKDMYMTNLDEDIEI